MYLAQEPSFVPEDFPFSLGGGTGPESSLLLIFFFQEDRSPCEPPEGLPPAEDPEEVV